MRKPETGGSRIYTAVLDGEVKAISSDAFNASVRDLIGRTLFVKGADGAALKLRIKRNQAAFAIVAESLTGDVISVQSLDLMRLQHIVTQYRHHCLAYDDALANRGRDAIETLDLGRTALHDEGGEAVREQLSAWVPMDWRTARSLFAMIALIEFEPFNGRSRPLD